MIEITDKAASELKILIAEEDKDRPGVFLRIFIAGIACSGIQYGLALDESTEKDDVTVESNGIKVIMTKDIAKSFEAGSIDLIEDENGKGFMIRGSTVSGGCGSCSGGCN